MSAGTPGVANYIGGEVLKNASQFSISGGNFKNKTTIYQSRGENRGVVFEWFEKHIISGAEFDSAERDPPPRCCNGTRLCVLDQIQVTAEKQLHGLVWVRGAAGVGKSAIMQTLAEKLVLDGELISVTLFFPAGERNDPHHLFPTLACQLARHDSRYEEYIRCLMARDPQILSRAIEKQFEKLVIEPFAEPGISARHKKPWIFVLDGLNDCGVPSCGPPSRTSSEYFQRRVIQLIVDYIARHPHLPFLWVFATRSEPPLTSAFRNIPQKEIYIEIDSPEARKDIDLYLFTEFTRIRQDYSYSIPSPKWPADDDFIRITTAASGFFAYATSVSRFIDDTDVADPVGQLQHVILSITRGASNLRPGESNPFALLDEIYLTILHRMHPKTLHRAHQIIALYIILSPLGREPPFLVACNILGFQQNEAYSFLRKLRAVLEIPLGNAAVTKPLKILHPSFADFIQSRAKSGISNMELAKVEIHRCCARIFQEANIPCNEGSIGNITLSWRPEGFSPAEVKELQRQIYLYHADLLIRTRKGGNRWILNVLACLVVSFQNILKLLWSGYRRYVLSRRQYASRKDV